MSDQGSKWDEKIQRSGVSAISNVALPSSHGFSLQLSELYGSEAIEAIGNCSQSNSTWEPKQVFARCCFRSKHIAIASKLKSGFQHKRWVKRKCGQSKKKSPTFFQSSLLKCSNPPPKKTHGRFVLWSGQMTTGPKKGRWSRNGTSDLARPRFVALDLHFLERRGPFEVRPWQKSAGFVEVLWIFFGGKFTKYTWWNVRGAISTVDDLIVLLCIGMYCGVVEDAWAS